MNLDNGKLICMVFMLFNVNAQKDKNVRYDSTNTDIITDEKSEYKPFQFHLTLKNMHLWRGFRSTDEALSTAELYYISKDNTLQAGSGVVLVLPEITQSLIIIFPTIIKIGLFQYGISIIILISRKLIYLIMTLATRRATLTY